MQKKFLLACAFGAVSLLSGLSGYAVVSPNSEHNTLMRVGRELRSGGVSAVEQGYSAAGFLVYARDALESVRAHNVSVTGNSVPAVPDGREGLEYVLADGQRLLPGFLPWGGFQRPELEGLIEEIGGLADYISETQVSGEEARELLEYSAGRIWDSAAPDKFKVVGYALACILPFLYMMQSAASALRLSRNNH